MPRVTSILARDSGSASPVAVFEPGEGAGIVLGHVASWASLESDLPPGFDAWIDLGETDLDSLVPGVRLTLGTIPVKISAKPLELRSGYAVGTVTGTGTARPGDIASYEGEGAPRAAVLTLSDSCSRGEREDGSGRALVRMLSEAGLQVVRYAVMPDGRRPVSLRLASWCDDGSCNLVLTTGGTGFSPTDETPEATNDIVERPAPGLAEMIRFRSSATVASAWLSRAAAGIRAMTLVVNLPGSVKGATEACGFLLEVLPHALEVLAGRVHRCGG